MAYRSTELAARERIDLLEEELLEAEAELERQAEELQCVGLRMREQVRLQRAEQTQKTRAVTLEPKSSRRTLAVVALLVGMVVGVLVSILVVVLITSLADKPSNARARLSDFTNATTRVMRSHASQATPRHANEQPGVLRIDCKPACESIFVSGKSVGPSPAGLDLIPGTYRVSCKANRISRTVEAQISPGELTELYVSMK